MSKKRGEEQPPNRNTAQEERHQEHPEYCRRKIDPRCCRFDQVLDQGSRMKATPIATSPTAIVN